MAVVGQFGECLFEVREFIRASGNLQGQKWRLFYNGGAPYKSYSAAVQAGLTPEIN